MRASIITLPAGVLGAAGVAGAAYAAHASGDTRVAIAAALCLVHAPAILAVGLADLASRALDAAAACWIAGVVLFSGALFLQALFAISVPSAPFGGSLMILGWLCAAAAGFGLSRHRPTRR